MESVTQSDGAALEDNVEISTYDVEELRAKYDDWDDLSREEKLERLESEEPEATWSKHNMTFPSYRKHLARMLHPGTAEDPIEVTHIAFGDTTEPDTDAETVGNEVYRTEIDDPILRTEDDDAEVGAVSLLTSDNAVGLDLVEAALVTTDDPGNADDMAVNWVHLDDPLAEERLQPKTHDHAVTIAIDIFHNDAGGA